MRRGSWCGLLLQDLTCFASWDAFLLIRIVKSIYLSNCLAVLLTNWQAVSAYRTAAHWMFSCSYKSIQNPRTSAVTEILKTAHLAPRILTHSCQTHWYHWHFSSFWSLMWISLKLWNEALDLFICIDLWTTLLLHNCLIGQLHKCTIKNS